MTGSKGPDDPHLVRAPDAGVPACARALAAPTGMARLSVSEAHLAAGQTTTIPPEATGPERFLFVLAGRGKVRGADSEVEVAAGDFLAANEPLEVRNPYRETLVFLSGGENS
jgi:mannose-6-phosphate isomerase-like protein (cupin superfamily)